MTPTILLRSGCYFDLQNPEASDVSIGDIAHSLARLCRFTGHTAQFYSVAQHSVRVSEIVPPEDALAGLLHDAAEAFLGDVSSPLKALLPEYRALESRVSAAIFARFGLAPEMPPSVRSADLVLLASEVVDLLPPPTSPGGHQTADAVHGWACLKGIDPKQAPPLRGCMSPDEAEGFFLSRFERLTR